MTIQTSAARRAVLTSLITLAFFAAHTASAAPTASGKAFDLNIEVDILGIPLLVVTPQDKVEFANVAIAVDQSQVNPSLTLGNAATVYLSTDELSAATQWIPGNNFLAVGSRAAAVNVNLFAAYPMASGGASAGLLGISATQIQATAAVTGTCPPAPAKTMMASNDANIVDDFVFHNQFEMQNLTPSNTSDLPGLQIVIAGTSILNLPANPLPNASIDIGGVGPLILNKQSIVGDGITALGSIVDGLLLDLHLKLGAVSLLDATVDISHAEASIACN
ncbi:MAG: choice-of-anchor P family protein [Rudaea sp.]